MFKELTVTLKFRQTDPRTSLGHHRLDDNGCIGGSDLPLASSCSRLALGCRLSRSWRSCEPRRWGYRLFLLGSQSSHIRGWGWGRRRLGRRGRRGHRMLRRGKKRRLLPPAPRLLVILLPPELSRVVEAILGNVVLDPCSASLHILRIQRRGRPLDEIGQRARLGLLAGR